MDTGVKLVVVINVIGRTGSQGQVTQVKVKFLGNERHQIMRNVKGHVHVGDILALMESEIEARKAQMIFYQKKNVLKFSRLPKCKSFC
ncbi:hypothetical protein GIB67_014409 [Kingdonia uniflora]|uniref:40S ribosomal protein S28 n=1 Tax=Kingdonia uniflora TaxID=39325 RepID=A0A7J7LYZ5_9MAGN|nr:hypothetical protein GIB67_014409 [Kingdonia uniflora]